jgi:transposase
MVYVGLDVSSKSFVVHVIDEKKRVMKRGEIAATRAALRTLCAELGSQRKLVAFEAGNQMKWIADTLKRQPGVTLHVVHPNEVKWIAESGGKKTDKVDARKLAELARGDLLPRKVHLVEGPTRAMRELVSARARLMQRRVSLINTLRGYLKQEGVRLSEKFFAQDDWRTQLAGRKVSASLRAIIEAFRPGIEALQDGEVALVTELRQLSDDRTRLLESIPSIGVLSARTVVSALDDATRFDNRKCVAKYGALTPTIYQSGHLVQHGRINRDGRQEIRRVLLQCAHAAVRMKSPASAPLRRFYLRLEKTRGKKKALVALARKLLVICYGVLKSGQPYDPTKLTGRTPPPPRPTRTYRLRTAA